MSQAAHAPIPIDIPAIPTIPVRQILPWAVFAGLLLLIVMYFVSTEQGALSVFDGTYLHELVHDGRHLLGFPCH
ncbi:CbtB domain-containing protein [Actinophytocola glycyrrhizae]|uniref:CbtB-domain containing protein n=1 Tax=Actinophytocola glycyrrhizae TaxID=2044873 RepID=A0ABV9SD09_9PSEU